MDELEPNARTLLDRARVAVSPSAQDVDALAARLGLSPPTGPSGGEPSAAPGASGGAFRRVLLGTGLAAAAVAAAIGAWASSPSPSRLAPSLASVPATAEVASARPDPPATPNDQPSQAPPPLRAPPRASASKSASKSKSESESKATPKAKPEAVPESDLAEELTLILRARRALKTGDDTAARDAAQAYARRFPSGSFGEEARALELIAACNLGPSEVLRRAARAQVDETAAFAPRIRRACLDDR